MNKNKGYNYILLVAVFIIGVVISSFFGINKIEVAFPDDTTYTVRTLYLNNCQFHSGLCINDANFHIIVANENK